MLLQGVRCKYAVRSLCTISSSFLLMNCWAFWRWWKLDLSCLFGVPALLIPWSDRLSKSSPTWKLSLSLLFMKSLGSVAQIWSEISSPLSSSMLAMSRFWKWFWLTMFCSRLFFFPSTWLFWFGVWCYVCWADDGGWNFDCIALFALSLLVRVCIGCGNFWPVELLLWNADTSLFPVDVSRECVGWLRRRGFYF